MTTKINQNQNQQHLSEQLQLLSTFDYWDSLAYCHGYHQNLDKETATELELLNVFAACLTSDPDEDGDIAVAIDRRQRLTLVLARDSGSGGGGPTKADINATRDLISVLTDTECDYRSRVFPVILSRCRKSMCKYMQKLHALLVDPAFLKLESAAIKGYLQRGADYLNTDQGEAALSPTDVLNHLRVMKSLSQKPLPDTQREAFDVYYSLAWYCWNLTISNFMKYLYARCSKSEQDRLLVEKLNRRLGNVSQYVTGVRKLIKTVKHYFPTGEVPFRWVDDDFSSSSSSSSSLLHLDPYADAIQKHATSSSSSTPTNPSTTAKFIHHPSLIQKWDSNRHITTHVHAEIRLLLHLSAHNARSSSSSAQHTDMAPLPIGCSRLACLCCYWWIRAYNRQFGTRWVTCGSRGRPRADWELPARGVRGRGGVETGNGAMEGGEVSVPNEQVKKIVGACLESYFSGCR